MNKPKEVDTEKELTTGSVTLTLRFCPHCGEHKMLIPAKDEEGTKCELCLYCYKYVYDHDLGEAE